MHSHGSQLFASQRQCLSHIGYGGQWGSITCTLSVYSFMKSVVINVLADVCKLNMKSIW